MAHQPTQELILSQMFDNSIQLMQPAFEAIIDEGHPVEETFNCFLQEAKVQWIIYLKKYLSDNEINSLVQAFFHTSQIDQQKLLMFNTVYTQQIVELAQEHFSK